MSYRGNLKKVARIRIAGPDQKGIIATITSTLYQHHINIEDIDQRILEGYLIMNMIVDISGLKKPIPQFIKDLKAEAQKVGTEVSFQVEDSKRIKKVALLVTKELHCLENLLKNFKQKKLKGKPVIVIGNYPDLESVTKKYGVPFVCVSSEKRKWHENELLKLLKKYDVDLIVLARYMQILSPEFVFRYEGKIINIHPSLLPSFPGPRSYHQAFNKGVEIAGVTAHFVTTDLDEGPIICQDCFKIDKTHDSVEKLIAKGRKLESNVLTRAVKLFLEDRLCLRRGKVLDNKKLQKLIQTTQQFFREADDY